MKKMKVRCWSDEASCGDEKVTVFFTVPDFGDAPELFVCPHCGGIFGFDAEAAHYSSKTVEAVTKHGTCPECNAKLAEILPYPTNFFCPRTGRIGNYSRQTTTIPPYENSVIIEVWDLLSNR